jgi:hypothetical protein
MTEWLKAADGSLAMGNGCAEASITRALLEYDPTTPDRMANPEWANVRRVHDPADAYGALDLMDHVSMLARNQHLGPADSETYDVPSPHGLGIEGTLTRYGLQFGQHCVSEEGKDAAWQAANQAPMSILWVDGSKLSGAYLSEYYFTDPGEGNHILLWLPTPDGVTLGAVNDPLANIPDLNTDTTYSLSMLWGAFYGCWVIPTPESARVPVYSIKTDCDLKKAPNHLPGTLERLTANTVVTFTGERIHEWARVIAPDGTSGYVLWDNVAIN